MCFKDTICLRKILLKMALDTVYLDFLTNVFLYLEVTLALKNPRSCIGLEIRPQSAFTNFRALLPSANNSAE
jgi:hypothetical protein